MSEEGLSLEERALRLSRCLADSEKAYSSLLKLEKEQNRLIQTADIEGTAAKIDEKNQAIEKIQEEEKRLHQEHVSWQAVRERAPADLRERLQRQLESLQTVISELLEVQNANEVELRKYGKEISGKLIEIQRNRAAHRGYQQRLAGDAYQKSKFYDKNT